jgi:hypothetical protein
MAPGLLQCYEPFSVTACHVPTQSKHLYPRQVCRGVKKPLWKLGMFPLVKLTFAGYVFLVEGSCISQYFDNICHGIRFTHLILTSIQIPPIRPTNKYSVSGARNPLKMVTGTVPWRTEKVKNTTPSCQQRCTGLWVEISWAHGASSHVEAERHPDRRDC